MATITTSPTQQRAIEMNLLARKQRSLWGDALWRLRRNNATMVGLPGIVLPGLRAVLTPHIPPRNPTRRQTAPTHKGPPILGTKLPKSNDLPRNLVRRP